MSRRKTDTILSHAGRNPSANHGIINPPVYHCSTVVSPTLDALENNDRNPFTGVNYGRIGTPTSFAFEDAVAELEGGYRAVTASSGLGAITTALMAFAKAGDHILITDSVYGPTRRFCMHTLTAFGVEVEFYDPLIGDGIAALIRENTTLVFTESPGSLTFEVQDIPAIAAAAHARGAKVLMDNTWATPVFFRALDHGVDVSIHAGTKYLVGHADAMMGVIVCTEETFLPVKSMAVGLGQCAGPDDLYLALRGLRTLSARLERHEAAAIDIAEWLAQRPEVERVLHPALSGDAGHALWKRDFTGSSGLFSVLLHPVERPALAAMLDGMTLFALGYSWGGFESLIIPARPAGIRTAAPWTETGTLLRLHVGLEDADDLKADLEAGLQRLAQAR